MRQAQQELTTLIRELRPAALEHQSLVPALRAYCAQWSHQTGIAAEVRTEGDDEPPPAVEESLFRIAQEALTNVARHSQATSVRVELVCARDKATLTITDDGQEFDPAVDYAQGVGLHSMRARAQALGGVVHVESAPGHGTTVRAHCVSSEVSV